MDGELILVLCCVGLAGAYLLRQMWRTFVGTGKACDGCGCGKKTTTIEQTSLIPLESLTVRLKKM